MKQLITLLVILMAFSASLYSCKGNDEPEIPTENVITYNATDSAAFCEVLKTAYGPHINALCKAYGMKLDSIPSWPQSLVKWERFDDISQYRIRQLWLGHYDRYHGVWDNNIIYPVGYEPEGYPLYGTISKSLWDMDSLYSVEFVYGLFRGPFPTCAPDQGQRVGYIGVGMTGISEIPLEIMTLPNLSRLIVNYNPLLRRLPDGFDRIPPDTKDVPTVYQFIRNSLSGDCPSNMTRTMWFDDNDFNSVDWNEWEKIDFIEKFKQRSEDYGIVAPILINNKITGNIPEKILRDTVALLYTHYVLSGQRVGYGLENMPPDEEIMRMRDEYVLDHPELEPFL